MSNEKIVVFDILGSEVATLVNKQQKAGNYEVTFNASNLSSGVYFYRLQSGNFVETKKMLLMRKRMTDRQPTVYSVYGQETKV